MWIIQTWHHLHTLSLKNNLWHRTCIASEKTVKCEYYFILTCKSRLPLRPRWAQTRSWPRCQLVWGRSFQGTASEDLKASPSLRSRWDHPCRTSPSSILETKIRFDTSVICCIGLDINRGLLCCGTAYGCGLGSRRAKLIGVEIKCQSDSFCWSVF